MALRIRPAQLAQLEDVAQAHFRDSIVRHLLQNHGRAPVRVEGADTHLAELRPELLQTMVASALARGRAHGLHEARALTAFAVLSVLVAPTFDLYPEIAAALKQDATPPDECMEAITTSMTDADWEAVRAVSEPDAWDAALKAARAG